MRDLSFLSSVAAPEEGEPGLPAFDERLDEVLQAVDDRLSEAADAAERLHKEAIHDVRVLPVLLLAVFEEDGLLRLEEVLNGARVMLERQDAFGPTNKRLAHADKRLAWLLGRVFHTVEYHQKKSDQRFGGWLSGLVPETAHALTAASEALALEAAKLELAAVSEPSARLTQLLRQIERMVTVAEVPAPPQSLAAPTVQTPTVTAPAAPRGDALELPISSRFRELLQKLEVFERLVQERRYERAAIVALDLQQTIEAFDPRLFFPKLFSAYTRLRAEHVAELSPYYDEMNSRRMASLIDFYNVDLDAFAAK